MERHSSNIYNIHNKPSSNNPNQETAILNGNLYDFTSVQPCKCWDTSLKQVINYLMSLSCLLVLYYNHTKLAGITAMFWHDIYIRVSQHLKPRPYLLSRHTFSDLMYSLNLKLTILRLHQDTTQIDTGYQHFMTTQYLNLQCKCPQDRENIFLRIFCAHLPAYTVS